MSAAAGSDVERCNARRLVRGLLAALALTAVSLLLWGNAVEEIAKFLPIIHRIADPTAYPGDRDLEASMRLLNWGLLPFVPFERLGVLDGALFAGTVLARLGLAAAAMALAWSISRDRWSALGGALTVLVARPDWGVVGAFRVIGAEPVASHLALPVGVAALAAAFRGRPVLAGALAGLSANVHPMMMAAFMPALLGAVASHDDLRAGARAVARALLAACVTATPVIMWTATNAVGDLGASDSAQDIALLRETAGAHVFWELNQTAVQSEFVGSIVAALLCLPVALAGRASARRVVLAFAGALTAIAVYLVLCATDLAPLLLFKACVLRNTQVTSVLARVLIGLAAVGALRRRDRVEIVATAMLLCSTIASPALVALAAPALGVVRWRRGGSLGWALLGMLPIALFAPAIASGQVLDGLGRAAVVVLAALALAATLDRLRAVDRVAALAAPVVAVLGAGVVLFAAMRVSASVESLSVLTPRLTWRPEQLHDAAAVDLARWAATQTPPGARFLIGADETAFLAYSRRSMVASKAVVTLSIWDVRLGRERLARVAELGTTSYHRWPATRVEALARRHDASFVVIERHPGASRLTWEIAYENQRFVVHRAP